jgi:ABC-2 type transport system permease protein
MNAARRSLRAHRLAAGAVLRRELGIIGDNFFLILMVIVAPLLYPFLYNTVYLNKMEHRVSLCIVDQDRTAASRQLIRDIDAHELLAVDEILPDLSAAKNRLEALKTSAVIVIPEGFEADGKRGRQTRLGVAISNLRFLPASDIGKALGEVLASRARSCIVTALEKNGLSRDQATGEAEPVHLITQTPYNLTESYGDFIIAGLFMLILQQTLIMGLAGSMSMERENGTIGGLFRAAGNSIGAVIVGKGGFYVLLFAAHAAVYCSIYYRLYRIPFTGSVPALLLLTMVHLMTITAATLWIASFFRKKITVMTILLFTSYPFFFMSGYSWPSYALPPFLRIAAALFPSTPFFRGYTIVTQMGGGFADVRPQLLHLLALLVVAMVLLWVRLRALRGRYGVDGRAG